MSHEQHLQPPGRQSGHLPPLIARNPCVRGVTWVCLSQWWAFTPTPRMDSPTRVSSKEQANAFKKHRDTSDPQGNLSWAARLGTKALRAGPEALARIDVEREFDLGDDERVLWRLIKLPRKYLDLEHTGVLDIERCRAFFRGLVAADVVDIVDGTEAKALLPAEVKRVKAEIAGKQMVRPTGGLRAKVYRPDIDGKPAQPGAGAGAGQAEAQFEYVDSAPVSAVADAVPSSPTTAPRGVPAPTSHAGGGAPTTAPRGVPAPSSVPARPLDTEQRMFKEEIDRAYAAMPKQNHYEFMGVSRPSDDGAVRVAYMRLAREFHPDKVASGFDAQTKQRVDELFKRLGEAHDALKDIDGRANYDRTLDALGDGGATTGTNKRARRPLEAKSAFTMAETFFKRKDLKQAEAHYRQAHNFDPEDAKIATALAFCIWLNPDHEEGQRTAEARKRLTEIVNSHRHGDAAYKLGLLLRKANDEAGAQRQFAMAHKLDPTHTDAQREVRLTEMRHQKTKEEKQGAGGLLGKLLKK